MCEAASLPEECRGDNARGHFEQFLHMACDRCWDSSCYFTQDVWTNQPTDSPDRQLQMSALRIVEHAAEKLDAMVDAGAAVQPPACVQGILAALLVLLQVGFGEWHGDFVSALGTAILAARASDGSPLSDLSPFPFNREAWDWYKLGGYVPVSALRTCDGSDDWPAGRNFERPRPGTKLMLLARVQPHVCPYLLHDDLLVRRCRQRMAASARYEAAGAATEARGGWRRLLLPAAEAGDIPRKSKAEPLAWACPSEVWSPESPAQAISGQAQTMSKYDARSCAEPTGSWGWQIGDRLKCVLVTVAELLGFRPGQRLLDWGSGCGWFVTWAQVLYGTRGFGIDVSSTAVSWAQRYSLGDFCQHGGLDLAWVPDGAFDYVTSYWALYHLLSKEDQCSVIGNLIQKLGLGGKMWLGGNCPDSDLLRNRSTCLEVEDLRGCLSAWASTRAWHDAHIAVEVEMVNDIELFRSLENRHVQVEGDYLFWGKPYSAFITRV